MRNIPIKYVKCRPSPPPDAQLCPHLIAHHNCRYYEKSMKEAPTGIPTVYSFEKD